MIDIRPVSDLSNKFTEIESAVQNGNSVYLTKNGYGAMVVLSLEKYSELLENMEYNEYVEELLDEADEYAESTNERLTREEVFANVRRSLNGD